MSRTTKFLIDNASWLGAGAVLTGMSSFGQTFFISIFAGEIRETFSLSHGSWGLIYALGTTASGLVMIWAGVLTDIYRARTLGILCLLGLAASCALMAVNASLILLPIAIFCLRFTGQGMASHVAIVAMARWFVRTRGRAIATASLGFSLAEMILPVTFVFLLTFLHWRSLWVIAAAICLFAAALIFWLLREERVPSGEDQSDERLGMGGRHWTRSEALRHPLFWYLTPGVLGLPAFGTAFLFHQVHYSEIKDISHLAFVSLLPVYSGLAIGSMVVSGILLDRIGTPRMMPFVLLPVSAAFFLFGMAETLWMLALGFVFMGLSAGAYGTTTSAFWAEVYGTAHIGAIKALAAGAMVLSSALGPILTGLLIDAGIGLEIQYIAFSLYFLATCFLIWLGLQQSRDMLSAIS